MIKICIYFNVYFYSFYLLIFNFITCAFDVKVNPHELSPHPSSNGIITKARDVLAGCGEKETIVHCW